LDGLNITKKAWEKAIHRGIKPIRIFAHPLVIKENSKRIAYYRMLAMVSQKSMSRVGLDIKNYENGILSPEDDTSLNISKHLNRVICSLIEQDETIDDREFDIWRGMAAGSQAQGSWQNTKGDKAEIKIKAIIKERINDRGLAIEEAKKGKTSHYKLRDNRNLILSAEPDVGIYRNDIIEIAIEIKGGIDPAGVFERFGAVLKSLRRIKQKNKKAITILIIEKASLTSTLQSELEKSKEIIDCFFSIEEIIINDKIRNKLFEVMDI